MPELDIAALTALYADNGIGAISAADLRAGHTSWHHDQGTGHISDGDYYVCSKHGDDLNTGTSIDAPFATIQKAVNTLSQGNRIYVRGGRYPEKVAMISSGAAGNRNELLAYPGEHPIIDASGQADYGLKVGTYDYWTIQGITVTLSDDNNDGWAVWGDGNWIIDCVSLRNGRAGFGHAGTGNVFLRCRSMFNYDPANTGEHSDGFQTDSNAGTGNYLINCFAYRNGDDGFDNAQSNGNTYVNCVSMENGYREDGTRTTNGDGWGFKIRLSAANDTGDPHRYVNCVSIDNVAGYEGADSGVSAGCNAEFYNCTSIDQGYGFSDNQGTTTDVFYGCTSATTVVINAGHTEKYNSWN